MLKIKIASILLAAILMLFLSPALYAHEAEVLHEEPASATSTVPAITFEDLGITKTGILPTNPFYFAKEWERKLRIFFTGNPVKKAELELKFTNEKAAELKRIAEDNPREEALTRAIENYNESADRLESRLKGLQESSNPNIDELVKRLTDRVAKHNELFEELKNKRSEARNKLEQTQIKIFEKFLRREADEVRPPPPPALD